MNAPKKIWISEQLAECRSDCVADDDIPYIRADLVDGLVDALEGLTKYVGRDHAGKDLPDLYNKAIYALKALEDR